MRAVLLRTGSVVVLPCSPVVPGSPRVSLSRQDSASCLLSAERSSVNSPRISMHFDSNRRRDSPARMEIRRAYSETDLIRCESQFSRLNGAGSRSFQSSLPEEECLSERDDEYGVGSLPKGAGIWPESGIPLEELGFFGGGFGRGGKKSCGGDDDNGIGNREERSKIGAYYLEMLKSNPEDSLLLRNYGKYLHEVENDTGRAEEYYGRAILASPGDGELLSLYGNLIWETQKDVDRAKSYFDQAVHASPDDCMVLGSYANFMWEAEEEEEEENEESKKRDGASPPVLVAAF
ncbi:hypothetical protein I3760_11G093300 [Carya illinoinensis]|uniref:TmcB/TmcC TPR repeats domain-containing protein n=1 Tax=Carya illinoinensis TaxID=32201 RepID=A0A922IZV9_CARIL|nr:hypothetical protein I3760_11G093300 [Carya illinoinensis]KAG6687848.1 hypothetical protein I3842_11G094800 [Carya illinoinensis]